MKRPPRLNMFEFPVGDVPKVAPAESLFKATLRDGEDPQFTRVSLQGSVSGGLVKARLTVHESDAPVVEVSGQLKRFCWAKGGGREILILTNGEQVVALFRELDPSMPCKPTR